MYFRAWVVLKYYLKLDHLAGNKEEIATLLLLLSDDAADSTLLRDSWDSHQVEEVKPMFHKIWTLQNERTFG